MAQKNAIIAGQNMKTIGPATDLHDIATSQLPVANFNMNVRVSDQMIVYLIINLLVLQSKEDQCCDINNI